MTATLRCEIFPANLAATVCFYVRVLGFSVVGDGRIDDQPYVAFQRGEVKLGAAERPSVTAPASRQPPIGVELVLEVDDLEAERERVAGADWPVAVEITVQSWGLRDFRVLDPDGYYWRITSWG